MKKLLLLASMAFGALTLNAQTVNLSTYAGTDVKQYAGMVKNVSVSRQLFTGWNTLSLPFDLSAQQVKEAFGSDCRLEQLVGVEEDGAQIVLNFQACTSQGLKANVPYILYYTGETGSKRISVENTTLRDGKAEQTFTTPNGVAVTFAAAQMQTASEGKYGIFVKDNDEATFVNVDSSPTGFLATRCFVSLADGNATVLRTNHLGDDEATAVSSVLRGGEQADVYNIAGAKVASQLNARGVNSLPAGVYVVIGKKVAVR